MASGPIGDQHNGARLERETWIKMARGLKTGKASQYSKIKVIQNSLLRIHYLSELAPSSSHVKANDVFRAQPFETIHYDMDFILAHCGGYG